MSRSLKISLSFSKKADGSPVYYKIDGQRFKENKTLKFHVNTTHNVTLQCRPALDVRFDNDPEIQWSLPSISISGIKVDGALTKKDESSSRYEGTWSSGMLQKTSNSVRTFLRLCIMFEDGATIETSLQCKLYPLKDKTHVVWGTALKYIEMKCNRGQNQNLIFVEDIEFI